MIGRICPEGRTGRVHGAMGEIMKVSIHRTVRLFNTQTVRVFEIQEVMFFSMTTEVDFFQLSTIR